ncbi:MAG: hypothetical protein CFE21_12585 [Bacteroidetes bacterium B1(2017)]|nr:MAG: hypothetical protein CFE21_12585 [Bacteroidetes bacterium B1(2017)]
METSSIAEIKKELQQLHPKELIEICLRLAKFKKTNKELAHYLLFEVQNEEEYIRKAKEEISSRFIEMPTNSLFFTTKYIRKTLRIAKLYAQYSKLPQTEIELLIHFCSELKQYKHYWKKYQAIENLFDRQIEKIIKDSSKLHEDLQYDYKKQLENLTA